MERALKKLRGKKGNSQITSTDHRPEVSTSTSEQTIVRERVAEWHGSTQQPLKPTKVAWFETTVNATADLGHPWDVSEHSSFLQNGGGVYTFPQFYATPHEVRESDEHSITTGPDLQASSEYLSRAKYPSDDPLRVWRTRTDHHLAQLLISEAPSPAALLQCPGFHTSTTCTELPTFQCMSCINQRLYCSTCCLQRHRDDGLYFHGIRKWTGTHFTDTSLSEMGLVIQMGHDTGDSCPLPRYSNAKKFVVIDIDGVHVINIQYCGCGHSDASYDIQLLQSQLYPSTTIDPETCATFRALEHFQMISFMSKVTAWEYFHTACRLSDNTGTSVPPDRYQNFLLMVRQWRYLKMLKRFGRANDPTGRAGTKEGDLAVRCPACPYVGINTKVQSEDYTDQLFLAMDANFRLQQRGGGSSLSKDPAFNDGAAYFCADSPFEQYLKDFDNNTTEEKNNCSRYDAVKLANMKGGKGTTCTGVVAVVCARHDMKRPTAVVNLKKGERYVFTDYTLLKTLKHSPPNGLVVSYDIACIWSKNLPQRVASYGAPLKPSSSHTVKFLVPKFHLPAHIGPCRYRFSFNWIPGMGRTDGEAPERNWAASNGLASSTKVMGSGSRRDTLDDHFGDQNWRKSCLMPSVLLSKLRDAVDNRATQVVAFLGFQASLESTDELPKWRAMVTKWEKDPQNMDIENPFEPKTRELKDSTVQLLLAREEAEKTSAEYVRHSVVGPSQFITMGLDLQISQLRMKRDASELKKQARVTDLQNARFQEKLNRLQRRVEAFKEIQGIYMPSATVRRATEDRTSSGTTEQPYDTALLFPSDIRAPRNKLDGILISIEFRLREARAEDALGRLREHLLLRSKMYHIKERQVRGQVLSTRASSTLQAVNARIDEDACQYRIHYSALNALALYRASDIWRLNLRELHLEDMRTLEESDESEGRRTLSWIWISKVDISSEEGMQEALRIEWCKSRARAQRWQEECNILRKEMKRVIASLRYDLQRWQDYGAGDGAEGMRVIANFSRGAQAYACRQAAIRQRMLQHAEKLFSLAPGDDKVVVGALPTDLVDVTVNLDTVVDIDTPTS